MKSNYDDDMKPGILILALLIGKKMFSIYEDGFVICEVFKEFLHLLLCIKI